MNKRLIAVMLIAVSVFVFCSCQEQSQDVELEMEVNTDKIEVAGTLTVDEDGVVSYDFGSSDIVKMSAYNAGGEFAVDGETIYGRGYKDGKGQLVTISADLAEKSVLADVSASNLNIVGDTIYYIDVSGNGSTGKICSMKKDGTDIKTVVDVNAFTLQVFNDSIYYTDANSGYSYYKCDITGENSKLLVEGGVYYPYVLDDRIVYQSDRDGETLHLYTESESSDKRITNAVSYNPVFDGAYVYYTTPTGNDYSIGRVNLDTFEEEIIDGLNAKTYELFITAEKLYYYCDNNGKTLTYADIFKGEFTPSDEMLVDNMTYKYIDSRYNIFVKNTPTGVENIVISDIKINNVLEYLD